MSDDAEIMNIGLDFGTANSLIAYKDPEEKNPKILIPSSEMESRAAGIPSVFWYGEKGIVTGETAKSVFWNDRRNVLQQLSSLCKSSDRLE